MAFTYDPNLGDPISQVRNYVGDTEAEYAQFQDEEIQFFLDVNNGSVVGAASEAVFRLYVAYSQRSEEAEVDDVRVRYGNIADNLFKVYNALKEKTRKDKLLKSSTAPIFFGGLDKSKFDANREDSTVTPPDFTKGVPHFNRRHPSLTDLDDLYKNWR